MVNNLTSEQIQNIQIDEGILYADYDESSQKLLGPVRGGSEFSVNNTVRNIEYDGSPGASAGMQVIEEQVAMIKANLLDTSQDSIAMLIPGCVVEENGDLTNPDNGLISEDKYLKNLTMFAKTLSGKYKKIVIYRAMHEGGFSLKAVQKAEGELALEASAHFNPLDKSQKIWRVSDVDVATVLTVTSDAGGTGKTIISVTGKSPGNVLYYKTAATVTAPTAGAVVDGTWEAFSNGAEYTATAGHKFTVVEANTGRIAIKSGTATVVVGS